MTPRADVCLHSLKGVLQQMLGERGLSISMSEALSMALLDPAQLEKTVLHLAQNAAETVGADWHMAIEIAPACVPGTAAGSRSGAASGSSTMGTAWPKTCSGALSSPSSPRRRMASAQGSV